MRDQDLLNMPFLMPIHEVASLERRGTIAIGQVLRGRVAVGDEVEVVGLRTEIPKVSIRAFEGFIGKLEEHHPGDNAALVLGHVHPVSVQKGMVLAEAGSIRPHRKFIARLYVLRQDEGGRNKNRPFFSGYRPQFYVYDMDADCEVTFPADVESVMPGDNVNVTIELITWFAIEHGQSFELREGRMTAARGEVVEIIE